jgi:SAM-dependent methyltransferase
VLTNDEMTSGFVSKVCSMSPSTDIPDIYWQIVNKRASFPGAQLIQIDPGWRDATDPVGPAADLFRRHVAGSQSVLGVGAGDRQWEQVLRRLGFDGRYASADPETHHEHDYDDFLAVKDRFDVVMMLELIEHLPAEVGVRFMAHAAGLLNRGGVLVVSTPNPRHAHQSWSPDFTHIRPWPAHDIWALGDALGFARVEVHRQMLVPRRRRIVVPLQRALCKVLELDSAHGLLAFAHMPS